VNRASIAIPLALPARLLRTSAQRRLGYQACTRMRRWRWQRSAWRGAAAVLGKERSSLPLWGYGFLRRLADRSFTPRKRRLRGLRVLVLFSPSARGSTCIPLPTLPIFSSLQRLVRRQRERDILAAYWRTASGRAHAATRSTARRAPRHYQGYTGTNYPLPAGSPVGGLSMVGTMRTRRRQPPTSLLVGGRTRFDRLA